MIVRPQSNIVELLDNSGAVVVKYKYDAWGKCVVDASTTNTELANLNPFRYRSYRPRDFKTAGLSALTAGVFSFLGNGFGNYLASVGPELGIQIAANSTGSFYFNSYIFIADAIIKKVSGG